MIYSDKLTSAITANLPRVTNALYAARLIPKQTKEKMFVSGLTPYEKASELVIVIEEQLEASLDSDEYFLCICEVLRDQQSPTLTDIVNGE